MDLHIVSKEEIKPVNPQINPEYSLEGLMMLKLKLQAFWSSDANSQLIGKFLNAGKDREQEKRASEERMARWHHRCNGHELGQTSGDGEEQRGLACCILWGRKESDTTGQLNNNRHCHTEWNKSEREGEIAYDSPYMWNLQRNDTNEFTSKIETDSQRMNLWLPVHTAIFKMDNQ